MDLYEKSLNTIELPAVLKILADSAVSDGAKENALLLRPSADTDEVKRRQNETTAAKNLIAVKGGPSFFGVRNVGAALKRAEIGGAMNIRELLDVAGVLKAARTVKAWLSRDGAAPTAIDYLFNALTVNKYLEEKITNSITGEDEIADAASSELATIRRHIRAANARVRDSLQKIISSPTYAKALQEPIITMRSDRYVVPVKAEHKNAVPGLVHDISGSGGTLFIEPMSVVQANNEIRELAAREKKEIERIIMELSADCAQFAEDIILDFNVLTDLDLIFAKAKMSYNQRASEPEISDKGVFALKRARHPLLPAQTAVPIDVSLGGEFDTLVITGPNTGGKTVTLKTLGLLGSMAQCGLHIPADDGSAVPVFDKVLADIGDEQSIEQSLSTFSSHMTNIVKILDKCTESSLVLFDELGAGTDPAEGAALAIAIIEYARSMGAKIAATTHYAELKVYATTYAGVQNASCEFDVETLRPTYRLLIGIPGKSNAFAISARLGIPESIIEDAKGRMSSETIRFEDVLHSLDHKRQEMEKESVETRRLLRTAEENAKKTEEYRLELEKEREKAREIAKREAKQILEEARRAAEETFDELNEMKKRRSKEDRWQEENDARAEMRRRLNQAEEKLSSKEKKPVKPSSRPVGPGDKVEILSMGTTAEVISVSPDRVLSLQAGIMKITAKEDEVRLVEGESTPEIKKYMEKSEAKLRTLTASPEIDLRGMMAEEAVAVAERFLDTAVLAKLNTVTLIHGKGTGALRQAVQTSLKRNRQVKSFRSGRYGEGEAGVTIVELK